jgi:hypothetical protein
MEENIDAAEFHEFLEELKLDAKLHGMDGRFKCKLFANTYIRMKIDETTSGKN